MSSPPLETEDRAFRWPTRADYRHLLDLAGPVVVIQLGLMLMGAIDVIMVGHYAALDLAATALGNLYSWGTVVFGMGVLMALDPLVAQAVGAKDREGTARSVQRGFVIAAVLTVPIMLAALPADWVLEVLGQPAEIVPLGADYARVVAIGALPTLIFIAARQSLQAMKKLKPIVITMILANVLNLALDWILVFGKFGAPTAGTMGVAAATCIARWFLGVGLLVVAWRDLRPFLRPFHREVLKVGPIVRTLRLGLPIGAQFFLEYGMFAVIALLMGRLGTIEIAAHQVAINIASVTFMVPMGISAAVAVVVGQAVGKGDAGEARRVAVAAILIGVSFMALSATTFLLFPDAISRLYSSDAGVIALAVVLIPIAGFFQVWDGIQVVAIGILRGVGDTRAPMVVNVVGFWLIGLPVSLWLAFTMDLGARGLWWGLVIGLFVVAVWLSARVRSRLSKDLERVIVEDPTPIS